MNATKISYVCNFCGQPIQGTVIKTNEGEFCYQCMLLGRIRIDGGETTRWPNAGEPGGAEL